VTIQRAAWTVLAPLGVCLLLAGWIAMSAANFEAASFSILIFGLANLIVYTDALDYGLRLYVHRRHTATAREGDDTSDLSINIGAALPHGARRVVPTSPYAIIASVFNLEDDVEAFIEAFAAYRERVWLVSDGSTDNTVMRLRRAGWRCLEEPVNRRKPGAVRALLETLPDTIATIMVIDPDIRILARGAGSSIDLERFIGDFQLSGAAAACPRVVIEPDGFLARFQAFEYALAFRVGRASLSDFSITSGAVSLYRRDALVLALQEHSLSVYAEDFENAMILLGHGERIYYDGRLVVSTEGPGSVSRWFSQRVGWYHGLLKVYTERFSSIWRVSRRTPFALYHFIVYIGVLSLGLHCSTTGSPPARSPTRCISRRLSAAISRWESSRSSPACRSRNAPMWRRSCRSTCFTLLRTSRRCQSALGTGLRSSSGAGACFTITMSRGPMARLRRMNCRVTMNGAPHEPRSAGAGAVSPEHLLGGSSAALRSRR
jgi:glycosyltransferase involved in cell wall biosynthesis